MIDSYRIFAPYLLLVVLALGVALLHTVPAARKPGLFGWVTALGALLALWLDATGPLAAPWNGFFRFDAYARAFDAIFLLTLAVVAIGSAAEEHKMPFAGEYYALLILSTMGLMMLGAAGGLLALYLGLELSTLCLIGLVGFTKRERRSAEAALKMLVLGAVASAVVLYGASILYGIYGTTQFSGLETALAQPGAGASAALWLGLAFVVGGLAFKIAAAPFHLWAPDVYEGAPMLVTAYLSTASKAGGFAALLRLLMAGLPTEGATWQGLVILLAVFSMIVGNLTALAQTNLKRLLAYSGIAQAGYILVALAGAPGAENPMSVSSAVLYLFLYAFTNLGGFLIAQAVADATGSDSITALRGLHRRSPGLAFATLVVLFSLGGIPPLAGFVGKLYLFAAAWQGGQHGLVLLGALTSVIALYYYLMVALQVYIRDPEDDRRMVVARPLSAAIALCILATLAIGIYPRPWITYGQKAAAAIETSTAPLTAAVHRSP